MKKQLNWLIVYQSLVYAAGLLLATGIITDWGDWYSTTTAYRNQTEAFFSGSLSLSQNVRDLEFDHTWSESGVHQVWGLGVPAWRLPWEGLARLFGRGGFPDRIAFGLFTLLVGFAVLKMWLGEVDGRGGARWRVLVALGGCFAIMLLFPPVLALLQVRGLVWEEAVAYAYMFGVLQVTLLIAYARRPTRVKLWGVCLLAGLGGFIRPTLVLYGIATFLVCSLVWWVKERRSNRMEVSEGRLTWRSTLMPLVIAGMLFCLGGGALWWTNLKRFGYGFEFGHQLNVQTLYGSMYATRFDDPYQEVPLAGAATELFGAVFLVDELNGADFYRRDIFPGQAPVPRWREFYFPTFDLSYLALVLVGWGAAGWSLWRCWRVRRENSNPERPGDGAVPLVGLLGAWSFLSVVPLLSFYLYTPVISSRYVMDLAPAFAAATAGAWVWGAGRVRSRWGRGLACLGLCAWMAVQLDETRSGYGSPHSVSWEDLQVAQQQRSVQGPVALPGAVTRLGEAPSGIPYDRGGWNQETGAIKPTVILFVNDAAFLELELATTNHPTLEPDPGDIRAKVGLEHLQRESITETDVGWIVRFEGPRQDRWQNGLQTAFLATVPNQFLAEAATPWILKSVRWRAAEE